VLDLLRLAVAEVKLDQGFDCEVTASRADSGFETSVDSRLVKILEQISGKKSGTVAFGTEAAQLIGLGAEAVVMGPGDIRTAHQTNEFVPVDELERCAGVLKHAIELMCGD
jgi:acetylornithine deacetylase